MVQANKTGYKEGIPMPAVVLTEQTTVKDLALTPVPDRTGAIIGTVTDATTTDPIKGAKVTATNLLNGEEGSATTGDDGTYEISDLGAGVWSVMATKAGYKDSIAMPTVVVPGQDTTRDLTMKPIPPTTGSLSGTVTDAITTDPIEGATVTAQNLKTATLRRPQPVTMYL